MNDICPEPEVFELMFTKEDIAQLKSGVMLGEGDRNIDENDDAITGDLFSTMRCLRR